MDGVLLASKELKERFTAEKGKTIYLSLGLDLAQFQGVPKNREEITSRLSLRNKKVILFLGPLEERKGIHTFAEAAKMVLEVRNDVIFVVATYRKKGADRKFQKSLSRLQKAIFRKEAHFRIIEGHHDVPLLMSVTDIFVLPAREAHGTLAQPLTLLEAMAMGKAIVASHIEGVRELISDGVNGFLFEKEDSKGLSRAIVTLLNDENLIKRLGDRARKDVVDFDTNNIARRLMSIYRNNNEQ